MTHNRVCDTSALVACCLNEPGADMVRQRLYEGGCVMHAVNVSEFCSAMPRKLPGGFTRASALQWLEDAGIKFASGFDLAWARNVAEIRHAVASLSIGDGVAITLADALGVPVMASDKADKFAAI